MRPLLLAMTLLLAQDPAGELRVVWGTPGSIDPAHAAASPAAARVVAALFSGLTTIAADGVTVAPGVAERWTVSDDGLVWTFHLAETKWSDGSPVTSRDFSVAWTRALRPEIGAPDVRPLLRLQGAASFREDRRVDQDLLAYDMQPVTERRALATRFAQRATTRHANALTALAGVEKDADARGTLEKAATDADKRGDLDEGAVGVEAAGGRTLRVTLAAACPTFAEDVASVVCLPVPARLLAAKPDQWTHPQNIVTNGPYRLERWTSDELSLIRVAGAGPERVILLLQEHLGNAFDAYERGRADWIEPSLVPPEKWDALRKRGDLRVHPTFESWHLRFNTARAPCERPAVRVALTRAVDRFVAVRRAGPGAEPALGLVPAGVPGYAGPAAPGRDTAAAMRALLGDTPDITKFPKLNLLGPKRSQEVAFALKDQLERDLGISVRTDLREWPAYVEALEAGDYDVAYTVVASPVLDPAIMLEAFTGWSKEADALLDGARRERDGSKRLALLGRAEALLVAEGGPAVPLHTGSGAVVARARVGIEPNPMGRVMIQHVRMSK